METEIDIKTLGTESVLTLLVAQEIPARHIVSCRFISPFNFDIQSSLSVLRLCRLRVEKREIEDVIVEEE